MLQKIRQKQLSQLLSKIVNKYYQTHILIHTIYVFFHSTFQLILGLSQIKNRHNLAVL